MNYPPQVGRCPVCQGELVRIHRTRLDVAISHFVPVVRLRCRDVACGWQHRSVKRSDPRAQRLRAAMLALVVLVIGVGTSIALSRIPIGPISKSTAGRR